MCAIGRHDNEKDKHADVFEIDDLSDDEKGLSRSMNSAHFSNMEENFMKEHELKLQAFESFQIGDKKAPTSPVSSKRRMSFIDLPPDSLHNGLRYQSDPHDKRPVTQLNVLPEETPSEELIQLYCNVLECLEIRHKYLKLSNQFDEVSNPKNQPGWTVYPPPPKPFYKSKNKYNQIGKDNEVEEEFDFEKCVIPEKTNDYKFELNNEGVFQVFALSKDTDSTKPIVEVPTLKEYYTDLNKIAQFSSDGPTKSFAFKRLLYLEARWNMYYLLNGFEETKQSKANPHRDFYNVRKVDTHIHHSACMNQKHLLRFIKYKLKTSPDEKVIFRDGKVLTLNEVFESLHLTGYDLSIDTLDMHAHVDTFHRFDKFNLKYNPIGESRLREIFLKTDNFIKGRYLAELTKQVFDDLESSKYQMTELRISVYGRSYDEWDKLAAWIVDNKLFSHNVRWLIQVPRLYDLYKKNGNVKDFGEILNNLFGPLYEVSINPKSHPKLHVFLERVIGFDSVDDESKSDRVLTKIFPPAGEWDFKVNPPYSYYLYYLFANIVSLNKLRSKLGFNTFLLRPHCGEAGDPEHLISAFLTSHSISHGILLRKIPYMQYLFYLDQIGLAMSPLSNNALFLTYDKNPFFNFFQKGLNVSLSTDDPLQFSYTKEPLIEEYSVAAQIYKLSSVDMCELAYNSVKQSGWEALIKKHWLGKDYMRYGIEGNDIEKTNVPLMRASYREETLKNELNMIKHYTSLKHMLA